MTATEGWSQEASVEACEIHLHLVGSTAQRRDRAEVLPRKVGELVDERGKLRDRQVLHPPLRVRHRGSIARLQVLSPHTLGDGNAVAHRRGNDSGQVARRAEEM